MTTTSWMDLGRRLGAPGVDGMRRDPGAGRALLAAVVVGLLWAQGGALRTVAGLFLLVALATPGPDGKSLLQVSVEQVQSMLAIWTGGN
jgi:hypothetical protein